MKSLLRSATVAFLPTLCFANPTSPRVDALFKTMLEAKAVMPKGHEYVVSISNFEFPKELTWDDVPALLARSASTRPLHAYLYNPISSRVQSGCSEGMMAMWLVDGIRKGDRFPSLNPLCWTNNHVVSDSGSPKCQAIMAKAYAAWWNRVKALTQAKARVIDPLKGAGLSWYGSDIPTGM